MLPITISVSRPVIEANPELPVGEPYGHGVFENAAGHTDEFVPGVTEECPKCYASLDQFFVGQSPCSTSTGVKRHRHLADVCPECSYIPYKDEVVKFVPSDQ